MQVQDVLYLPVRKTTNQERQSTVWGIFKGWGRHPENKNPPSKGKQPFREGSIQVLEF